VLESALSAVNRRHAMTRRVRLVVVLALSAVFSASAGIQRAQAGHYAGLHWPYYGGTEVVNPLVNDFIADGYGYHSGYILNARNYWVDGSFMINSPWYESAAGHWWQCELDHPWSNRGSVPYEIRVCSGHYGGGWVGGTNGYPPGPPNNRGNFHYWNAAVLINLSEFESGAYSEWQKLSTARHELGHAYGLGHSNFLGSVMHPTQFNLNAIAHDWNMLHSNLYQFVEGTAQHNDLVHDLGDVCYSSCYRPGDDEVPNPDQRWAGWTIEPVRNPDFMESMQLEEMFDEGATIAAVELLDGTILDDRVKVRPEDRESWERGELGGVLGGTGQSPN
jgi:hypothetical protein